MTSYRRPKKLFVGQILWYRIREGPWLLVELTDLHGKPYQEPINASVQFLSSNRAVAVVPCDLLYERQPNQPGQAPEEELESGCVE